MTSKNTRLIGNLTTQKEEIFDPEVEVDVHFFEKLVDQTEKKAYSAALYLTHDQDEADDLVQETYIKAWRNFGRYIKGKPFLNWILKMMQRLYIDKKRRNRLRDQTESTLIYTSQKTGKLQEIEVADIRLNPEEEILKREFEKEMIYLFFKLPMVYLHTILMCDIGGMSYKEIAALQQASMGTVRSRIHRGRKLLRKMIQDKGIQSTYSATRTSV